MFCPKCGKSDQQPETFCRQCGIFLPDLSKPAKKSQTPQDHVTANLALSTMTIVVAFTLAILLYSLLAFRSDTHPLIYFTAGLLIAIGAWHIQSLWRTLLLRKHFKKNQRQQEPELAGVSATDDKLLEKPNFDEFVPASVTDRTTRHLSESKLRSTEPEH